MSEWLENKNTKVSLPNKVSNNLLIKLRKIHIREQIVQSPQKYTRQSAMDLFLRSRANETAANS